MSIDLLHQLGDVEQATSRVLYDSELFTGHNPEILRRVWWQIEAQSVADRCDGRRRCWAECNPTTRRGHEPHVCRVVPLHRIDVGAVVAAYRLIGIELERST